MAEVSVTLKAGPGYDSPWIIVKADTVREVSRMLNEIENFDLDATVVRVSAAFRVADESKRRYDKERHG